MTRLKKIWWLLPLALFLLIGAGLVWASTPLGPSEQAREALTSDSRVDVDEKPWFVFTPKSGEPTSGLILYPGGRVDPRSYAPLARDIAENGYLVVIPRMPLNLAVLGSSAASEIIDSYPSIQTWLIGGHSLGGAMAASYAMENTNRVDGLVLLAAYPASSDDLSNTGLDVISISGSEDGLATPSEIEASRSLLPPDSSWVVIQGGNHAQFGSYGVQGGDGTPTISEDEQRMEIVGAILELFSSVQ